MKKNDIERQQLLPEIRRLQKMLQTVTAPQKAQTEWATIERNLFSRFAESNPQKHSHAFAWVLKPYATIPGFAAVAFIIGISILMMPHEKPVPVTRPISLHGGLIVHAYDNKPADTVYGATGDFHKALHMKKGYSLTTLENSTFILQVDKECALALSPNSNLTIEQLDEKNIAYDLSRGTVLLTVNRRKSGQSFRVKTPNASCTVIGTIFKVDVIAASASRPLQTVLTVYEGKVAFVHSNNPKKPPSVVSAGQQCRTMPVGGDSLSVASGAMTSIKAISTLELLVNSEHQTGESSGLIDICSQPDEALAILDDTIVGKTPLLLRKPVGSHYLKLSKEGCLLWEKSVTIGKDSISCVSASLSSVIPAFKNTRDTRDTAVCRAKIRGVPKQTPVPESTLVTIPDYVEAMIHLTIGEYQSSLGILDSLKDFEPIDMKSRRSIMKKINGCYAKLGDFSRALRALEEKIVTSAAGNEKEHLLWEIANIKANCLGDYQGSESALIQLLSAHSAGNRTREASWKLAEVQYMLEKPSSAAATLKTLLRKFPNDPDKDRLLFNLAGIVDDDLRRYREAVDLYTAIIDSYPHSRYYQAALFGRAGCFERIGRMNEAKIDYSKCLSLDPQGILSTACAQRLKSLRWWDSH